MFMPVAVMTNEGSDYLDMYMEWMGTSVQLGPSGTYALKEADIIRNVYITKKQ
jgi:hypothetical protein